MSKLKEIRELRGLSQSKLAELTGVNIQMIQKYEQGTRDINKAQAITVYQLAEALDVSVKDLLNL